jgi:hypothetical protein
MSDFLTTLLASQHGELRAIQPRLPTLYEPVSSNAFAGDAALVQENVEHETQPFVRSMPRVTSAAPNVETRLRNVEPTPYRGSLIVPAAQERSIPRELPARPIEESDTAATPDAISRSVEGVTVNKIIARDSAPQAIEKKNAIEPPGAVVPENTLQPKTAWVTQPIVRIARESSPERDQQEHAPAPAPIVHVSIGRILVRATQAPPAREKKSAASPPKLSLEDYLNARERGEP